MSKRWQSFGLLLLVSLILVYGVFLAEAGLHGVDFMSPWPSVGIILGSFWGGWIFSSFRKHQGDHLLYPLVCALCSISWIELYRLGPECAVGYIAFDPAKQALFIAFGVLSFLLVTFFLRDFRLLQDYKYLFLGTGILLQIAVMLFGIEVNGARLWFSLGFCTIQPIEFVKILVVIFLAAFLRQFRRWIRLGLVSKVGRLPRRALLLLGLGMACAESILVIQRDLGMALLLFGIFVSMFYIATGRRDLIAIAAVLTATGAYYCWKFFDHVQVRVSCWLDPFAKAEKEGYQMCQALFSLASGGFDGTGLGLGMPFLVPSCFNDFIFVSIAEELGMLGAVALMLILLAFIVRCFYVAIIVQDEFGTILASGLASLFAWQSLMIMLGTTKVMPMTGITLPFVSQGGSSVVSSFVILGLIWQISAGSEVDSGN